MAFEHPDMSCGQYPAAGVVETLLHCQAMCKQLALIIKELPNIQVREKQMHLLFDCADMCGLTARFISWNSIFARQMAALCAEICETCGRECARFPDPMSQQCAQVCFHCAMVCRAFSVMPGYMPAMGM